MMGKTAVVVIHGVGEQRPMATVRSFVSLFAGSHFRSKPDRGSGLFELRRLSTYAKDDVKEALDEALGGIDPYPTDTVFYEYYWAFHYRDTQVALVVQWVIGTIIGFVRVGQWRAIRWRVWLVVLAWFLLFLGIIGLVGWGIADLAVRRSATWPATLKLVAGMALPIIVWLVRPVFIGWVGDAARYFGTSPSNPVERQQIRAEGIQILKRLHGQEATNLTDDKAQKVSEYDRVIVVGHSLGSVVAYDMLTHYWAEINQHLRIPEDNEALKTARGLADESEPVAPANKWKVDHECNQKCIADKWQQAQSEFTGQVRHERWRVTDLVTLGSPLTYARFLIAKNSEDLIDRQRQRELPTCPPTVDKHPDKQGVRSFVYFYDRVTPKGELVPNHAATFLPTRWTNIFLSQDPIGGPLQPIFGWGIRDVEVGFKGALDGRETRGFGQWLADLFGAAHNRYWSLKDDNPKTPMVAQCATELRRIVMGSSSANRQDTQSPQSSSGESTN